MKNGVKNITATILWDSSNTLLIYYRVVFIEAFCILLRRFSTPCTWSYLKPEVGNHKGALTEMFYHTLETFYETIKHWIRNVENDFSASRAALYSHAFRRKGSPLNNCVGLIDDANLKIQEPHGVKLRATYDGHKRFRSLKFQALVAPGGFMLLLYVPVDGRRHDLTLFQ